MNIFGLFVCVIRGHKWVLNGLSMGMQKHTCKWCKRTKHTRLSSIWYDRKTRANGGVIDE